MNNKQPFILLVDDDEDDHFLMRSAIKEVLPDAKTQSLYNGLEAVNFLAEIGHNKSTSLSPPDVIFMDLNMPKLNGWQAAALLKNDTLLKDIPIIILSTSSDLPEKDNLLTIVDGFYSKPANSAALATIIAEVQLNFLST